MGIGPVARRDFVNYHLCQALRAAVAEADGDGDLSRCLHAKTKLRLICMSDEELWELAKLTSSVTSSPQKSVEQVYEETKQVIEEYKATASEWINDLVKNR